MPAASKCWRAKALSKPRSPLDKRSATAHWQMHSSSVVRSSSWRSTVSDEWSCSAKSALSTTQQHAGALEKRLARGDSNVFPSDRPALTFARMNLPRHGGTHHATSLHVPNLTSSRRLRRARALFPDFPHHRWRRLTSRYMVKGTRNQPRLVLHQLTSRSCQERGELLRRNRDGAAALAAIPLTLAQ